MTSHELWLVRTSLGEIQGPFSEVQLCEKLKEGLFAGEDEICRAGDYWFRLHERSEVMSKLGAQVPIFYPRTVTPEEELTQTETETTSILQTDPAHDPVAKTQQKKLELSEETPHFSRNPLSLWKILAGIFLIMVLVRLLLPVLRPE